MKKLATALIIILFSPALLFSAAFSYTPEIGVMGGGNFSSFDRNAEKKHTVRINGKLVMRCDFLALQADSHRISVPLLLSYDLESGMVDYRVLQPRFSASAMLRYSYTANKLWFSIYAGPRYEWYYRIHGALWHIDGIFEIGYRPADIISLSIPLAISVSDISYEVSLGAALTLHLDRGFRKDDAL